jgi:hypothetical protein
LKRSLLELIIVEETRNTLVGCGFIRDMLALGEKLPSEVVQWSLEHGKQTLLFS